MCEEYARANSLAASQWDFGGSTPKANRNTSIAMPYMTRRLIREKRKHDQRAKTSDVVLLTSHPQRP